MLEVTLPYRELLEWGEFWSWKKERQDDAMAKARLGRR